MTTEGSTVTLHDIILEYFGNMDTAYYLDRFQDMLHYGVKQVHRYTPVVPDVLVGFDFDIGTQLVNVYEIPRNFLQGIAD